MEWFIVARCDECKEERNLEVKSDHPPYEIGDQIEECSCGGKLVVEKIMEIG
jgi:hypothetical protein